MTMKLGGRVWARQKTGRVAMARRARNRDLCFGMTSRGDVRLRNCTLQDSLLLGLVWGIGGSREFAAELSVFGGLRFVLGIVFVARRGGVEDGPGKAAKSG